MPEEKQNLPAVSYYTPLELVGIYRSFLERGKKNNVVWLRGIYVQRPNQNSQWAYCYDELRDVDTNTSLTLKISQNDRTKLKPNSLVQIGGLIELNPFTNGNIQIIVQVTRVEIIKDQFISDDDLKRNEIRIAKSKRGFKNVDAVLEEKLFRDERPRVALLFASTSITMLDFNEGVNAAAVKIDFVELRQSFANGLTLASFLHEQDQEGYDVIALVRGGGSGIEALDDLNVLECVSNMDTPVICAIGHVGEELFLKSIADKVAPTPNGLGQYFSEMVEKVTAKRTNSIAALTGSIRKEYEKQIAADKKRNEDLLKELEKARKEYKASLDKQIEDDNKKYNALEKQLQDANKKHEEESKRQKSENDKRHEELIKQMKESDKKHQEEQEKQHAIDEKRYNDLLKEKEESRKEKENLHKQLQQMSVSQQQSIDKLTAQNKATNDLLEKERRRSSDLEHQLSSKSPVTSKIIVAAIIALIIGFIIAKVL